MTLLKSISIIEDQAAIITKARETFKEQATILESLAPFEVGDKLKCNGFSHMGKSFLVDKVYVCGKNGRDVQHTGDEPIYFKAEGFVYKVNKELGSFRGEHTIKIKDLIQEGGE